MNGSKKEIINFIFFAVLFYFAIIYEANNNFRTKIRQAM